VELLSIIGIVAFAVSGAIAAMEEEYDILGVYTLGLVTAFGGGAIRNLLLDIPITKLWEQGNFFLIALLAMTVVFIIPVLWFNHMKHWLFFDAIGLSAFAIQGALAAKQANLPMSAVIVAALLTGSGGGILRDILANRKPLIFRDEIYAIWAMSAGFCIALGFGRNYVELALIFALVVILRLLSIKYQWHLPRKKIK
jgi:uncharacterized membrane protein YeiH